MNEELDYAQMLEIPVSTVNVVKKKSFFKRKAKPSTDLKDMVVESVNERVGDTFVSPENLGGYTFTEAQTVAKSKDGVAGKIIMAEAVAACLIAAGIFLTNIFVPNTVINAFMGNLTAVKEKEASYTDFTLSPVVSELSGAEVAVSSDGVIHFTDKTSVYPICGGEVADVIRENGVYTVKIAHTSAFTSVFTGLDTVYVNVGDEVRANLPFAYSEGNREVQVSMYDGDTLLNNYTLSGVVPVWNT